MSWRDGPHLVGLLILRESYWYLVLPFLILLPWLLAAVAIIIAALLRKRQVPRMIWILLSLSILTFAVMDVPSSFWRLQFVDRLASGPHAAKFLLVASGYGDLKLVEALLSHGVSVNASDRRTRTTALHTAAGWNQVDMAEYLISEGSEINAVNRYGDSPLEFALRSGNEEVAKLMGDHGALHVRGSDTYRDSIDTVIMREEQQRLDSLENLFFESRQ